MPVNITQEQKEVIRKIIYGAETGGQEYGKVDYDCFTGTYTNSSIEHAITIGGAGFYATQAQKLLKRIRFADPSLFSELDTAGISSDLDNKNWATYSVSNGSAKAKCIQRLIDTEVGHKCQDALLDEDMEKYMNEALSLGVTDIDAQMMCANFRHHGGLKAMKRVVGKTQKPYTLDNLYTASKTDTGNQVGAYRSRQNFIYTCLKKYISVDLGSTDALVGGDKMSVLIGHASIDENGKAQNGKAGDQTGREVCTRYWYNKPWTSVIRPYTKEIAEKIAKCMEQACANNNIGYDQWQRTTLYNLAVKYGFDLSKITEPCETDCSALVAVCVNAAGIKVSKDMYTGIELTTLKNTGKFTVFTSSDYTASDKKLMRGDILLGKGHTAIVLSNGSEVGSNTTVQNTSTLNKTVKYTGVVTVNSSLNVRTGAGSNYSTCSFSPLKNGTEVQVCDTVGSWLYIKYNGMFGFVSSTYIKKKVETPVVNTPIVDEKKTFFCSYQKSLCGKYKTTSGLNMRVIAGKENALITTIPNGKQVICGGHYMEISGVKWYLVCYEEFMGFVSSKYLKQI